MKTSEKYKEMGFIELSASKVQDRHGNVYYPRKSKRLLKAVRQFCAECFGMDRRDKKAPFPYDDIHNCSDPMCPLFDFRLGKNPFVGRPMTEEQRKAAVERLAFAREATQPVGKTQRESTASLKRIGEAP